MRRARVDWKRAKARMAQTPGMALAGLFIGLSGLISVTFGYSYGGIFFAGAALAIEGFADLAVPLFWHRLWWFGRAALIAFFVVCVGYKLEAAKRFAEERLGRHSAATATVAETYNAAKQKVEGLRKTIAQNVDARAAGLIHAEIAGLLREPKAEGCAEGGIWNGPVTKVICPQVDKLRAELARAKARDGAQLELAPALERLTKASEAGGNVQASMGPIAMLLALLGIRVGVADPWQMLASLFMIAIEGGAILVPMLVGAVGRVSRGVEVRAEQVAQPPVQALGTPAPAAGAGDMPLALPEGITDRTRRDILDLRGFLADQVDEARGERIQSASFYLVYSTWKAERSEPAMSLSQFGKLLSHPVGLEKRKIEGKQYYMNVRLRHPAQGRKGAGTGLKMPA
jgi:hypothetical protein